MKNNLLVIAVSFLAMKSFAFDCKNEEQLHLLDQAYETAILESDVTTLDKVLDDQYTWVHNRVSAIESKQDLIARVTNPSYSKPLSRTPNFQSTYKQDRTWVVTGLSEVNSAKPLATDPDNIRSNRYFFMRTYVRSGKSCRLLLPYSEGVELSFL